MKTIKKILKIIVELLLVVALIAFIFGPKYIDQSKNKVTLATDFPKSAILDSIPFIADLHCDALLWDRNFLKKNNYGHVDLPRMQQANMAFQVFTIVSKVPKGINIEKNDANASDQIALLNFLQLNPISTWFSIKNRALHQCESLHNFADKSEGQFRVITNKKEMNQFIVDRGKNHKLTSGMLGIEGAHCLENDLNNLDEFYKAGVRYIGLAHFFDNEWAGSAHGMVKGGLTQKGIQLIKKMDSLHITIDLAHSSQQTIDDVFKYHNGPVLVSHTGVKGVCDNQRNLSDTHLLEIGRRNGLVGIGLWETAVCGKDAEATAKSIKYVADKIGVDKVALGSDWDGALETHFAVTGLPLMVAALKKEGFSKTDIDKIMGGNIRDYFLRNLPD
ncbi:MAG: dipeptidase [Lentimicrobium sp.]|jgi:microsomal dipeptidase-like Zn-dependent dipeptidase|nr:dipeptidase [Lentimicrobium sp.]